MYKDLDKATSPVIAVTFYSKRTEGEPGYYTGILSPTNIQDVTNLKDGVQNAAHERGHPIPQLEITLFLIPDWKKGETYSSPEYLKAKRNMILDAQAKYGKDVLIKDFVTETNVSGAELAFLINCESMGSVADIVKTRTIIDNKDRSCLQTDSNVTWANNNFAKLYALTFASNEDAFNTSRCSEVYVSAHNKVVFTASHSELPAIFKETLVEYCKKYNSDPWHKTSGCNGVYDIAFCEGMCRHGLTHRVRVDDKYNPGSTFDFYPANVHDPRYKLMSLVIACQRESWRAGMPPLDPAVTELTGAYVIPNGSNQKKPAIEIRVGGVDYGYYHFKSLIRVFTNIPSWHADEGKHRHIQETHDIFEGAEHARNEFVKKQDTALCMTIFAQYYNTVKHDVEAGHMLQGDRALQVLADLIPENEAGDKLCNELFACTAAELHANPKRTAILPLDVPHDHHEHFHVSVIPTFMQQTSACSIGKSPQCFFGAPSQFEQLAMTENLKMIAKVTDTLPPKERAEARGFFKSLPQEQLEKIKGESATAQKAWDEQYGVILYTGK